VERHGGRVTVEGARFTIELIRKASESVGQSARQQLEKGRP
jgi:hypothetical protein